MLEEKRLSKRSEDNESMEQTIRRPHVSMRGGGIESGREVGREGRREAGREGGREEGKNGSNNELIDECIAVCGSRNVIVVIAYADNDSKTVLLHLIRRPMTEMTS